MAHGSKWAALYENTEDAAQYIQHLLKTGELLEGRWSELLNNNYGHIRDKERPLSSIAVIQNTGDGCEVMSVYPTPVDVANNELELHSIEAASHGEDNDFEKCLRAITRDGSEISFFCPAYSFFQSMLKSSPRFHFGLGAIAYSLEKAPSELTITEGDLFELAKENRVKADPDFDPKGFTSHTIRMDSLRCYFEQGEGDIEFQSVAEEVVPAEFPSGKGYILLVNLVPEDRAPIRVKIYASKIVLGSYIPEAGDPVRGVAALQGFPLEAVEAESLWMDSAEAAHKSGPPDELLAGVSWMFTHTHLPLALQAVGGAFVAAGWQIDYIEDRLFRSHIPAFAFINGERSYFVFVRSWIKDFCDPIEWPEELIKEREAKAAEHGGKCLHLTLHLTPGDRSFDLSINGLEELSEEVHIIHSYYRPENFKPVNLDGIAEPEPLLDECTAAKTFARCMVEENLADLSQMLVEDFEYTSETVGCCIKGRQQFLSYMGNHLHDWKEKARTLTWKLGRALIEGSDKPCVLLFEDNKPTPLACTFFTGRKGHIATIRTLAPTSVGSLQIDEQ